MTYLELHLEYGFPDFAGSSVFVAKLRQTPQGPPSLHRLHGQVESTCLLPNKVKTVGPTHYVTYIEKSTLVFPQLIILGHIYIIYTYPTRVRLIVKFAPNVIKISTGKRFRKH